MPLLSAMMVSAAKAPFAGLDAIVGAGGLVVLAPHPDDESLGCGALMRAACCAGRSVMVVVVTDGRRSHPPSPNMSADSLASLRALEVRAAVAALHPDIRLIELGFHDCETPVTAKEAAIAAGHIAGAVDTVGATAILTAWQGDPHIDHKATAGLAHHTIMLRPHLRLWSYPIWGRFAPTDAPAPKRIVRFDPEPFRGAKAVAIACHRSQMTRMIDKTEQGFMMPEAMQAHFIDHPEV